MAIQVVNAVSNTAWTTDKVEIATTTANVTFQVSVVQLTYTQANGRPANATMSTSIGNLYANAIQIPGNSVQQYYVVWEIISTSSQAMHSLPQPWAQPHQPQQVSTVLLGNTQ